MSWLIADSTVRFMDAEHISLSQNVPIGIYNYCFNPMIGSWIEKFDMALPDDSIRIYGDSQKISNHCCIAWENQQKNNCKQNLGVLFSGGKGLGKSLTSKLIIKELAKKYPIVIVKTFTKDLTNFLSKLEGCIVFIDEFEKIVTDRHAEDESGPSSQESFLSLLDGVKDGRGNLFIFTANELSSVNNYMLSRPGRIRYHYRFESAKEDLIKDYCKDNLNNKELIDSLADALMQTRYVSMDIIKAAVDEVNQFPNDTIEDCLDRLNIEITRIRITVVTTLRHKETGITCTTSDTSQFVRNSSDDFWVSNPDFVSGDQEKTIFKKYGYNPEEDDLIIGRIGISFRGIKKIPLFGPVEMNLKNVRFVTHDNHEKDFEIVKTTIEDADSYKNSFLY